MRVIVMGTPEFAVPALVALAAAHEVVAVYTQPPRPGGRRGRELTPSPMQRKAEELGIAVRHPVSLKGAAEQAEFAAWSADIAVVAAYGLILPRAILDAPRLGCLNLHGSLLPRWRGAAPIQRAILAGDAETGVDIMRMEAGLDTGAVLAEVRTTIGRKNAGELVEELAGLGAALIVRVLGNLGAFPEVPQAVDGVTYAAKVDKAETRLDFTAAAEVVERQVRAFAPTPGAFFELEGERIRVLASDITDGSGEPGVTIDDRLTIACGLAAIRPTLVQRAGRPAMDTAALLRGRAMPVGTKLT
jgi:methionyl-tRNA formyltransferase